MKKNFLILVFAFIAIASTAQEKKLQLVIMTLMNLDWHYSTTKKFILNLG